MGSRGRSARGAAPVWPPVRTSRPGRRGCGRDSGPGGQLARSAAGQRQRDDHAAASAGPGTSRPAAGAEELAIAAASLPRLLRRLHPRTAACRDGGAEPRVRRVAARRRSRRAGGVPARAGDPRRRGGSGAPGRVARPRLRPCRGAVSERARAALGAALWRAGGAPRGQPGRAGVSAERPIVAARTLRRDRWPGHRAGAPRRNREGAAAHRSRPRRPLRQPRRRGRAGSPGARRGVL